MFKEINLRNHSSLHKLFYSLNLNTFFCKLLEFDKIGTFIKKLFVAFTFFDKKKYLREILSFI